MFGKVIDPNAFFVSNSPTWVLLRVYFAFDNYVFLCTFHVLIKGQKDSNIANFLHCVFLIKSPPPRLLYCLIMSLYRAPLSKAVLEA